MTNLWQFFNYRQWLKPWMTYIMDCSVIFFIHWTVCINTIAAHAWTKHELVDQKIIPAAIYIQSWTKLLSTVLYPKWNWLYQLSRIFSELVSWKLGGNIPSLIDRCKILSHIQQSSRQECTGACSPYFSALLHCYAHILQLNRWIEHDDSIIFVGCSLDCDYEVSVSIFICMIVYVTFKAESRSEQL